MNIQEVAHNLNQLSKELNLDIANLQSYRKEKYGRVHTYEIFSVGRIPLDRKYAFHSGGRQELQFNIGEEKWKNKKVFRYGVAYSLERDRTLHTLMADLRPSKDRFNEFFRNQPSFFDGFEMWYHENDKLIEHDQVRKIDDTIFKDNNFIFIGKYLNKGINELTYDDLKIILNEFEKFLPLYKYCLKLDEHLTTNEKRIARICWNDSDWEKPSGKDGKSTSKESHEKDKGYGHEEWLFDFNKLIDGFHYSLLQPAQRGRNNFLNKKFDIKLFSRNSHTGEMKWVAKIKDVEILSTDQAKFAHKNYIENDWLKEMALQLKIVDADHKNLLTLEPHNCFNIRFKPENAELLSLNLSSSEFKESVGTYHYTFVRDKQKKDALSEEHKKSKRRDFKFKAGKSEKSEVERSFTREKKETQIKPIHDKLQNTLYDILVQEYGVDKVGVETNTGNSTRIDVCVNTEQGIILYEVKSYASVIKSIREATGQLLEYAFYPNPIDNLKELIIVTHNAIDSEDMEYLDILRKKINLNIYYQSIDLEEELKTLSDKY